MDYLLESWMGIVRFEKMAHADAHDLLACLFASPFGLFFISPLRFTTVKNDCRFLSSDVQQW
jgi:hypothetical protein